MKYPLIIIITLFGSQVFSQTEQANKNRKMAYGLFFSQTINYRTITSNAYNDLVKDFRDNAEIASMGFRTGLTFDYQISGNIDLQFGLIFSNRIIKTKSTKLVWPDANITQITDAFISRQYHYVDMPLKVKYNFAPQNRLNWFLSGGVSAAALISLNQRNHVKISGDWQVTKDEFPIASLMIFLAEIEPGVEYSFHPKIKLRSSLNFQHAFTATNPNYKTKEYLYAGGISFRLDFFSLKNISAQLIF